MVRVLCEQSRSIYCFAPTRMVRTALTSVLLAAFSSSVISIPTTLTTRDDLILLAAGREPPSHIDGMLAGSGAHNLNTSTASYRNFTDALGSTVHASRTRTCTNPKTSTPSTDLTINANSGFWDILKSKSQCLSVGSIMVMPRCLAVLMHMTLQASILLRARACTMLQSDAPLSCHLLALASSALC